MAWEIWAIWALVIVTLNWFFRDERRRHADSELASAAAYYAHAPGYQYRRVEAEAPVAVPPPRRSMDDRDRAFFEALMAEAKRA